jgi:hypothetical protein
MKLIKPSDFVYGTNLVSTTATETYATWSGATTYALADRKVYGLYVYESLQASNLNHQPDTSPTWWVLVGPNNKFAMFDLATSTATTKASPLTVVVDTGAINSLAMIGLIGTEVSITMTDGAGGPTVYTNTIDLNDNSLVVDWYTYFFTPFVQLGDVVLTDLPAYNNARVTMVLTGSGTVQIGEFIYGLLYDLGSTEYGATVGIIDYSRKNTDEFGTTTFIERAFSNRMNCTFMLDNTQLNFVQRLLSSVRATQCVYIGSEDTDYAPLIVYGFYKDFTINIQYSTKSYCSLEIEGLT